MKNRIAGLFLCLVFLLWVGVASADPLDLSTFTEYDEPYVIEIGGIVNFTEDIDYATLYYADDYFQVPGNALELSFDYDLVLGADDYDDYLTFEVDFNPVAYFDFSDASGHFIFDLSTYQGQEISLAWGLIWGGDEYVGTAANISNIDIATAAGTNPVPEPATMLLLGSGLVGLVGMGRRKVFKKS